MWLRTKDERDRMVDVPGGQVRATKLGGGHTHWQRLTSVRATPDSLAVDLRLRLVDFEGKVRATFPDWDAWPASAQLATLGMAWAAGPHCFATFPRFTAAAGRRDWQRCAVESHLDETGNPGLRPRNVAQRDLFLRALRADPETVDDAGAAPVLDPALDPRNALVGAAAPSLIRPPPDDDPDDAA